MTSSWANGDRGWALGCSTPGFERRVDVEPTTVSETVSVSSEGAVPEQWRSKRGAVLDGRIWPFIINALHREALPDSDPRLQQLVQYSVTLRHCSSTARLTWFCRPSSSRSALKCNGFSFACAVGDG